MTDCLHAVAGCQKFLVCGVECMLINVEKQEREIVSLSILLHTSLSSVHNSYLQC